jgi:quinol monooxygenase YgiN
MYMRFLYLKINPDLLQLLYPFYDRIVIPALQDVKGCLFAGLIQSNRTSNECISVTLWENEEQAEAYEKSETYQKLLEQVKPYLSESTEWKIHLSENLKLQYEPAREEPVLQGYRITAARANENMLLNNFTPLYVRLVSIKLQEGKTEEFRKIYKGEIVPALQSTPGCRYIYLSESLQEENTVVSITIWDSREDADKYENSGRFRELSDKVRHTFSQFFQWKMELERDKGDKIQTSEDMQIGTYGLVSGKRFS